MRRAVQRRFWTESYGGPGVQPLTSASGTFLHAGGFLHPRGALTIARAGDEARLEAFASTFAARGVRIDMLGREAVAARISGLREGWTCGALEPDCSDIDVAGLHQHYLAAARAGGTELRCRAAVQAIDRLGSGWRITLADEHTLTCDMLVNAAGAWADGIAAMAGIGPIGIAPYRRTIAQVRAVPMVPVELPLVLDLGEQFYFKPEAGRVWLSPHDETPSAPCDAAADELDVALAIARLGEAVDWRVEAVEHRWAGLRSFAPDRLPVYGPDPHAPAFFWFAGQGGFGIQTAPAAAAIGAGLLLGEGGSGPVDPAPYSPARFC